MRTERKGKKRKEEAASPMVAGYDYSTAERREETVSKLFTKAQNERRKVEDTWRKYNNYYNFLHEAIDEVREYCKEKNLPWVPACIPDPYIMVESQIDPDVPEPEFRGRDGKEDDERAKEREYAVRYICQRNRLEDMNTSNERRIIKLGDGFWKAYWDGTMRMGLEEGDIRIQDIPVEAIYPDPGVRNRGLQAGQYVGYLYRIHKVEFVQLYGAALEERGIRAEDIFGQVYDNEMENIFDVTAAVDDDDDSVQVLEWWFKHPQDMKLEEGAEVKAGDIGCTIQAGNVEVKYIPKYWQNTGEQCKLFPFVHYWRIRDENSFWNKSELFSILDMVDAADRKLASTLLNDAFMANDIIVTEENSFSEGCEPVNEPGAIWTMKPNKGGSAARLGGLQSYQGGVDLINWLSEQIQRSNRNYDSNLGRETTRQTTATGLAMQREDADNQANIKKSDRTAGFERLYELLDWLALEFYDDDRMIFLGGMGENGENIRFSYNSGNFATVLDAVLDLDGNVMREPRRYYPVVDVTVNAGEGIVKGTRATLETLDKLTMANITPENWKIFAAELEILQIPQKTEIVADWEARFGSGVPREVTQALSQNPELLAMVEQLVAAQMMPPQAAEQAIQTPVMPQQMPMGMPMM